MKRVSVAAVVALALSAGGFAAGEDDLIPWLLEKRVLAVYTLDPKTESSYENRFQNDRTHVLGWKILRSQKPTGTFLKAWKQLSEPGGIRQFETVKVLSYDSAVRVQSEDGQTGTLLLCLSSCAEPVVGIPAGYRVGFIKQSVGKALHEAASQNAP